MIWRWLARKLKPYLEEGYSDHTEYWRRTLCPHGVRYDGRHGKCDQCPYTGYGYGKRIDREQRG